MPVELDVGRELDPPLTEREARAVVALCASMREALKRRLPLTLELVELDVELRRRVPLEVAKSAAKARRGERRRK